ncbi:GNAT family N-acetyltransferase [Halomonas vilamensis]|uniref:tRNA(Met) cytidine acetyltransferase TmcA n=1 Tax=Vreelandella vilamensis TaxID=531309 RepID=A0ABU1GZC9_9GAMM|nr:GNAT family N-acetyltransferase [Halomonas vilamensis]MDR5897413.1 GNAT family N-acetyltransferase [Halomonas vilamensis]
MNTYVSSASGLARGLSAVIGHAKRLQRRGWRQWLWLEGNPARARCEAQTLWHAYAWQAPLWVGMNDAASGELPSCKPSLPASQARTRLGQEHQLIVYDASEGFDPDALGALGGTLMAGGLLVLITPHDWGSTPDRDYRRMADYPYAWESLTSHYIARLARLLRADAGVIHWRVGEGVHLPRLPASARQQTPPLDADCLTHDQARAVAMLTALKRRRPLVITADRGRGKSAALGIACARLLNKGIETIWVTAPRPAAVAPLFERVAALCPQDERLSPYELRLASGQRVAFVAPDALTAGVERDELGGDGSYLLVDEAAAIPAVLLGRWLQAFSRIAFATTVHGYEGSGRGFALRFRDQLDRYTPQWRELTLETPVRWRAGDPLEATLNRLLLLKAPMPPRVSDEGKPYRVSQAALARDETALSALFGLLVQSHYRTTPADVRQLLDGPATQIRVHGPIHAPQGVVVTRTEGDFTPELAEQVARGERRPQGHLLAQSLAAHGGCRRALIARWRRVTRIAVHPEARRHGSGQALLTAEMAAARDEGIDLFGATFGAEAGLVRFWCQAGFLPVRVGISRDTTTGEFAVMVAKALSPHGEQVLVALRQRFQEAFFNLLAFELRELPTDVLVLLLGHWPRLTLSETQRQDAEDVAYAKRDPRLARAALQALSVNAAQQALTPAPQAALVALAGWAFQNRPLEKGHKASVAALRQAVAALL